MPQNRLLTHSELEIFRRTAAGTLRPHYKMKLEARIAREIDAMRDSGTLIGATDEITAPLRRSLAFDRLAAELGAII